MLEATVTVNLRGLKRFQRQVDAALTGGGGGPIGDAFKQWAARYRGFIQQRFAKLSKGGGGWPPLKPATIARRRGGKKVGKRVRTAKGLQAMTRAAILRDTGTLFAAVNPTFMGSPGQLETRIRYGIRVGYGGPQRHPSGRATVADIARFHQVGAGNLPKREIMVDPDNQLLTQMAADMQRAIDRIAGI